MRRRREHNAGRYALALNFGYGATPTAAPPNTQKANGSPLSGCGGIADGPTFGDDLLGSLLTLNSAPLISGVTPERPSLFGRLGKRR